MSEWFSVEDRLPNDGELVVAADGKEYLVAQFKKEHVEVLEKIVYFNLFYVADTDCWWDCGRADYWLRLPKLPEKR